MKKVQKPSPYPIYLTSLPWLVGCLIFGKHSIFAYVVMLGFSALIYVLAKVVWPGTVEEVIIPEPVPKDKDLAALMKKRDDSIAKMQQINAKIADEDITAQINHIAHVTGKIFSYVLEKPEKKPQIGYFLNYYLPTCIKLLENYVRLDELGVSGDNIDTSKAKIRHMLGTCSAAFDKQLDSLFMGEALDISSDITVMEHMMAQEGLK